MTKCDPVVYKTILSWKQRFLLVKCEGIKAIATIAFSPYCLMSEDLIIIRRTTKIISTKYEFKVIEYSLLNWEDLVYEFLLQLTVPVEERKEKKKTSWNIARRSLFGIKMGYIVEEKCVQTPEVSETYLVSRDWAEE